MHPRSNSNNTTVRSGGPRHHVLFLCCIITLAVIAGLTTVFLPSLQMNSAVAAPVIDSLDPEYAERHRLDSSNSKADSTLNLPEIHFVQRNSALHDPELLPPQPKNARGSTTIPQRRSVFRFAIFTDLHYGEDGHLDLLTAQFQQKVLESTNLDLVVMLGDEVSQLDYAKLRASTSHNSAARDKVPSCLRDATLGAKRCVREAHEPVLRAGVPFVTILGNHDEKPVLLSSSSSSHDEPKQTVDTKASLEDRVSQVSLVELLADIKQYSDSKPAGKSGFKSKMLCSSNRKAADSMCTLIVPRGLTADEQDVNGDAAAAGGGRGNDDADPNELKARFLSAQLSLSFFNSISDETDTVLLHGYKYPSQRQLSQHRAITKRLQWVREQKDFQRENHLSIAFVHVPPGPMFLNRESVVAAGGWMNETPGCSPRELAGPVEFSRTIVADADILFVGHDHKNDEWAVHDRKKLSEALLFEGKKLSASPDIHLVYARHSGFGGYFALSRNSQKPGARIVEIVEFEPGKLGKLYITGDERQRFGGGGGALNAKMLSKRAEAIRCGALRKAMPDLKLCRFVRGGGAVVQQHNKESMKQQQQQQHEEVVDSVDELERGGVYLVVRSWIEEPVLSHASVWHDNELLSAELKKEQASKAQEPGERLMHSQFKHFNVVGLNPDPQALMTVSERRRKYGGDLLVEIDGECSDEVDYRSHFIVLIAFLWGVPLSALLIAVCCMAAGGTGGGGYSSSAKVETAKDV